MFDASTLPDLLDRSIERARDSADGITHVQATDRLHNVTFRHLRERALAALHSLQDAGIHQGDEVILYISSPKQFIEIFWAASLGGMVPVPVAVGGSREHKRKLFRIFERLRRPFVCTDHRAMERLSKTSSLAVEESLSNLFRSRCVLVDDFSEHSKCGTPQHLKSEDTALIQFSSGSTSDPKGVVLTHSNLVTNIKGMILTAGISERDRALSWMPLTHDMGLIGSHLMMLTMSAHLFLMPTELFVRKPLLWLDLASRHRATVLFSPNFGLQYYLEAQTGSEQSHLDLSGIRLIFNGAEPISASLCREFNARLAPAKLRGNAIYPAYGLAEGSVGVSLPMPGESIQTISIDRHAMNPGAPVKFLPANGKNAVELVSEGRAIPGCQFRITGEEDTPLPENHIGHVQIVGDSVTRGYYCAPEINALSFTADRWLRTGDLGLIHNGELYISGRAKDIIFSNGRNYFAYDLENVAKNAGGLPTDDVYVSAVRTEGADSDQVAVFVLFRGDINDFLPMADEIAARIAEEVGIPVQVVVPVPQIPKTTSGKVQRYILARRYEDGEFDAALGIAERRRAERKEAAQSPLISNSIEDRLRKFCEATLDLKQVGIHDNLVELGLSSLQLVQLHEKITYEFPGQLDLADMFQCPTLALIAQRLGHADNTIYKEA